MAKRAKMEIYLQVLDTGDVESRRQAALKLGKPGNITAVKPLCQALHDRNWGVRRNAARSLAAIRSQEAVEPLFKLLSDKVMSVRREAIKSLGLLGNPVAVEPLCQLLMDKKEKVRISAIQALGQIGLPAIPALCYRLTPEHLESGQALLALEFIVRANEEVALFHLLATEGLTPEQRWNTLTILHSNRSHFFPFSGVRRQLNDPRRFCEIAARSGSDALRTGALMVLEYISLTRASQRSLTTEQGELLRAAQGSTNGENGATLLRGSERIEEVAQEDRSLWTRLRHWLGGK